MDEERMVTREAVLGIIEKVRSKQYKQLIRFCLDETLVEHLNQHLDAIRKAVNDSKGAWIDEDGELKVQDRLIEVRCELEAIERRWERYRKTKDLVNELCGDEGRGSRENGVY